MLAICRRIHDLDSLAELQCECHRSWQLHERDDASGAELQVGSRNRLWQLLHVWRCSQRLDHDSTLDRRNRLSAKSQRHRRAIHAGGINTYAGPITLTANATINSNSSYTSDQLILAGGIGTAGYALTFNGPGSTAIPTAIAGSGGAANTGRNSDARRQQQLFRRHHGQ